MEQHPFLKKPKNTIDTIFMHFRILPVSDAFLLWLSALALIGFGLWYLAALSTEKQIEISARGGSLVEGVIGTPRFVNPVLAVTKPDKDMVALIYDGLMKLGPEGVLIPSAAESVTVSEDGLIYNVILRSDLYFHDGEPLTSSDVVFTVGKIQEPGIASPLRTSFDGVTVEEINERELNFVLPEAYAPFKENLVFGILPRHVWEDATNEEFPFSQLNSEPIGSGPYQVKNIKRNTSGIPESYSLEPSQNYHADVPKIDDLTLRFYTNEEKLIEAFKGGEIDSMAGLDHTSLLAAGIDPKTHVITALPLPRTFALFFNQNKSAALRDQAARRALDIAIDRDLLIEAVLGGYGRPLNSPVPPGFGVTVPEDTSSSTEPLLDQARAILRGAGWKINDETGIWEKKIDDTSTPLSFSIATVNNPVFEATAEYLRTEWEKLGVSVTVKQFEQSDLSQAIIRPRDYEALLFGASVGRSLDLYSFWHSSQRNDPGLNVALYANITTDSILSEERKNSDNTDREAALLKFAAEINAETPAIFLYSPEFLYVLPKSVTGTNFSGLAEQSERFSSISSWYMNTESVWPLFN